LRNVIVIASPEGAKQSAVYGKIASSACGLLAMTSRSK